MTGAVSRRDLLKSALAVAGCGVLPSWAAPFPDVIAQIKPSLVAVGTFQRTRNPAFRPTGTGFAIGDGRLIVTNVHVVAGILDQTALEVHAVATSERGTATVREALLAATDPAHDIAILRLTGPASFPPLRLAEQASVREGQEIALAGYPLSSALGIYTVTHRGYVAALVPIIIPAEQARQLEPRLVRQLADGAFQIMQLDVTAYPGNSGSPVFDPATGEVLGVVNSGLVKGSRENALSAPSGITYAIPIKYVNELVRTLR